MIDHKTMVFIDGENLTCRFKALLDTGEYKALSGVIHVPDVYVWGGKLPPFLKNMCECPILRKHYYASVQGDDKKLLEIKQDLKDLRIEDPNVFKKTKNRPSKALDIKLATDMLHHAFRKNCQSVVLIAGDGDYVPLVKEVKREGCIVHIYFINSGFSNDLKLSADHYYDITNMLLEKVKQ